MYLARNDLLLDGLAVFEEPPFDNVVPRQVVLVDPAVQQEGVALVRACQPGSVDRQRRPAARAVERSGDVPIEDAHGWFADADALCAAVIEHQMVLLTDHLIRRATAVPGDDLVAQLRELTHAYIDWFFDNPVGGRLLVSPPAMAFASQQDVRRFSDAIYNLALSMMERARDAGLIKTDIDIPQVMLAMRALTLGIVLLQDLDHARLWGNPSDPRAALMGIMDTYFDLATKRTD